jgi:hypothetical protein
LSSDASGLPWIYAVAVRVMSNSAGAPPSQAISNAHRYKVCSRQGLPVQAVFAAQVVDQAFARAPTNVEHALETGLAAVVRVGHCIVIRIGLVCAQQFDLAAELWSGRQALQLLGDAVIDGQQQVEPQEIAGFHLPCTALQADTATQTGGLGPAIRRFTGVPCARARRSGIEMGSEPVALHEVLEDAFGLR